MPSTHVPDESDISFYRSAVAVLQSAGIEFLVGGAFAMRVHTGVERYTKDFDLFVRPADAERVIEVFRGAGFDARYAFSHWLLKVYGQGCFMDVIYRAGNGLCDVDDEWFAFAREAELFGGTLRFCPPEEMLWQKAYIMERERFDGADVQHLLNRCGRDLDWDRLIRRFGEDWPVLLSHFVLFRFVYPSEHDVIPTSVLEHLTGMLLQSGPAPKPVCRGTFLSRLQYLYDLERWGYADARRGPRSRMSEGELQAWTQAALEQEHLLSENNLHTSADENGASPRTS